MEMHSLRFTTATERYPYKYGFQIWETVLHLESESPLGGQLENSKDVL